MMKTIQQRLQLATLATALLLATACTSTRVQLSRAPVPNIDESKPRRIRAESSGFQLLLFIPIGINDRHEQAWSSLKAQAGKDYIADVAVQDTWTYALVGTVYTVKMEANAYPITTP